MNTIQRAVHRLFRSTLTEVLDEFLAGACDPGGWR